MIRKIVPTFKACASASLAHDGVAARPAADGTEPSRVGRGAREG